MTGRYGDQGPGRQVRGRDRREPGQRHPRACNGTAAQQWTVDSDGIVRALGKCLDVTDNGTANGSTVQLWDCTSGPNQKWAVSAAHDIVNPQANKCLDVTGNNSANGTRLQIAARVRATPREPRSQLQTGPSGASR